MIAQNEMPELTHVEIEEFRIRREGFVFALKQLGNHLSKLTFAHSMKEDEAMRENDIRKANFHNHQRTLSYSLYLLCETKIDKAYGGRLEE
jgi:hypothetical protein